MPFLPDYRTLGLLGLVVCVAAAVALRAFGRVGHGRGEPAARGLARFAWVLSASIWFLLVFGSSVRVNGAGLACPDWPACFGQVIPALDWPVFLEFGHRVFAGFVSLAFVALAVLTLRKEEFREEFSRWFLAAGAALATQVVLGGLTVLHLLAEWTVAGHLLVGNTFSALVGVIAVRLADRAVPVERAPVLPRHRAWVSGLGALVVSQLVVGGLVASSHAGLACPDWPSCNAGQYFPGWSGPAALQTVHRLVAYSLLGVALFAVVETRGLGRVHRHAWAVLGVVLAQATLGVANVWLRLPVEVTLLHSAGAAALALSVAWLNHEVWRAPLAGSAPAAYGGAAGVGSGGWSAPVGSESK